MDLKKVRRGDIVYIIQAVVRKRKKPLFVKDYFEVLERVDIDGFVQVRNLFSGTIIRLRPILIEPAKLRTILLPKETYKEIEARQKEYPYIFSVFYTTPSIQFDRIATYLAKNKYDVKDILFKIRTPHNEKVIYATSSRLNTRCKYHNIPVTKIVFNKFSKDFTGNEN